MKRYEGLFEPIRAKLEAEVEAQNPRGRLPHPERAYVQAYLVMLEEHHQHVSHLHRYLLEHPALVWALEFRLVPDSRNGLGFNLEKSVPSVGHLRRKLRALDMEILKVLLSETVQQAREVMPEIAETVAIDVKHIYAYVKENNPRVYVDYPDEQTHRPVGDPACRFGVKRITNQGDGSHQPKTEGLWGYGTGIAVAPTATNDAIVLAEHTQPFDQQDVSYGLPLLEEVKSHLGKLPPRFTADAAFDAWYLYQPFTEMREAGMVAIPLNLRGKPAIRLGPHLDPVCDCNHQEMDLRDRWRDDQHWRFRFECPVCHTQHTINPAAGNRLRWSIDRTSQAYKALYRLRTCAERINSQAQALGIDRPRQRTGRAIARRNTLTYILINLRAIRRFHQRKRDFSLPP